MVRTEALSASESAQATDRCERCGTALSEDQEWCLECGAARTLLRSPPDWRGPAAMVLAVTVLAVAVLVVVLVSLA
jgi:RNA polymerase subunit RPABC4/transcription elongation factor Spt4